jgi:hypothetical protein
MAVMKLDIHGVRTHWIRGFMTFHATRRTRSVVLMVPVGSESGFRVGRGRLTGAHDEVRYVIRKPEDRFARVV